MSDIVMKTPENLKELITCLKYADASTNIISGGTDLVIQLRRNKIYSGEIIDLSGIKELKYINEDDESIKIGSGMTLTEISEDEIVNKFAPSLVQATRQVGSTQIRNRATIAGNIANSSPCADTVVPLISMGGSVNIINGEGIIISKKLDEIIVGSGKNNLKKDEAIIEIIVPKLRDGYLSAFGKIGSRSTVTISKLNCSIVVKLNSKEKIIEDVNVIIGALGPKAFRSEIAETALINKKISKDILIDFSDALTKQVDISISGRKSQEYKREAIKGMAHDIFNKLFKNIHMGGEI